MFLMVVCMSFFGLAVTAIAFGAATRRQEEAEPLAEAAREAETSEVEVVKIVPPRFFADVPAVPRIRMPKVPIEALLLEIDNHVRLEQAAAESFLEYPTAAQLHSTTVSRFVH